MKKGLVLEGGALRGLFSAGVMDVLMEENIVFDGIVGVSAGAVFGCNYKSNQIGRTLRYNVKYIKDPRYCSFRSLIKTGDLFGKDFCYRELPFELDPFDNEAFKNNPTRFYVVTTDLSTGKALYKRIDSADEKGLLWMRASASLPLVSTIVKEDGNEMLDGGIADSVPLRFFIDKGYRKNLVVLTQPKGYVKKKNSLIPLIKLKMRKYPNFVDAMANRHSMYNTQIEYVEKCEKEGSAFIIRPSAPLPISKIEKNPENLKAAYEAGRTEALKNLSKIKEFLNTEKRCD